MIISVIRSPHVIGVDFRPGDTLEDVAAWLQKLPYKSKTNDLILIKSEKGEVDHYALVLPGKSLKIYNQQMFGMGDILSTYSLVGMEQFQPYCWNSAYLEADSNALLMMISQLDDEKLPQILARCILFSIKNIDTKYKKLFKQDIAYTKSVEMNKFAILDAGIQMPVADPSEEELTRLFYNFKTYLRFQSYVTVDRIITGCRAIINSDDDPLLFIIRKQCPLALFLDSVGE